MIDIIQFHEIYNIDTIDLHHELLDITLSKIYIIN